MLGSFFRKKYMLRKLFRHMRKMKFQYAPLVEVCIFREHILHNLAEFQKSVGSGVRIAPVLKSNAYGHGILQVAQCLAGADIPFLAVDSYYEALMLRNEGVKTPLVVIGYTSKENILRSKLSDVSLTIISTQELKDISQSISSPCRIHLKIDTGMHRQGIRLEECNEAISLLQKNPHLILEGIATHFADADTTDQTRTREQIQKWNAAVKKFHASFPQTEFFHAAATCGSFFFGSLDANVMRLGIGLYGIAPCASLQELALQPALQMRSVISSVKDIRLGDAIGYSATYVADHPMRIATVPVGYFEGVDRRLSNKGYVKIRETACPLVGRVSMNIITIDVSALPDVCIGEPVLVISVERGDKNSVEHIASLCDAIPYEILVHIPAQVRRIIV